MPVSHGQAGQTILRTADGVPISAVHVPGDPDLGIVIAHGFTGSWRQPRVQRVMAELSRFGGVLASDFRGHGRSGGACTMGMDEIEDVTAVVSWARQLGYGRIVTVGFSLGACVVVRQAALRSAVAPVDALVAVSGPAFWFYRGTPIMRGVHRLVESPAGRRAMRSRGVRISDDGWPDPPPVSPAAAAAMITRTPFLVVHGTVDRYFPIDHAKALHRSAAGQGNQDAELWIVPGFGHAERAIGDETLTDIGNWLRKSTGLAMSA